jgi:hypothetical protein
MKTSSKKKVVGGASGAQVMTPTAAAISSASITPSKFVSGATALCIARSASAAESGCGKSSSIRSNAVARSVMFPDA